MVSQKGLNSVHKMYIYGVECMVVKEENILGLFRDTWKKINKKFTKETKEGIEKILEETYSIIVKFIGTPPENFNWEYYDNNEPVSKYHIYDNLTPLSFYKMLKINVNDFVSISNNPNYQYNIPIVEFDGREKYDNSDDNSICIQQKTLNLDILRSIELIIRSINDNIPVWIGCSIGDNFNLNLSILDKNASRYENILTVPVI